MHVIQTNRTSIRCLWSCSTIFYSIIFTKFASSFFDKSRLMNELRVNTYAMVFILKQLGWDPVISMRNSYLPLSMWDTNSQFNYPVQLNSYVIFIWRLTEVMTIITCIRPSLLPSFSFTLYFSLCVRTFLSRSL
jgi:hypothetical protein